MSTGTSTTDYEYEVEDTTAAVFMGDKYGGKSTKE